MCFDDTTGKRLKCAPKAAPAGKKPAGKGPAAKQPKPKATASQKVRAKAEAVDLAKEVVEQARAGTMSKDDLLAALGALTGPQLDELKRHFKVRGGGAKKADKAAALAGLAGGGQKPPVKPAPKAKKQPLVAPPNHKPMTWGDAVMLLHDISKMDDPADIDAAFDQLENEARYIAATDGKDRLSKWIVSTANRGTRGARGAEGALEMVLDHFKQMRAQAMAAVAPKVRAKREKLANDLAGQKVDVDATDEAVSGLSPDGPTPDDRKRRNDALEVAPMRPASEVLADKVRPGSQKQNAVNIRGYIGRIELQPDDAEKVVELATRGDPTELAELAKQYSIPTDQEAGGVLGLMGGRSKRSAADLRADIVARMVGISRQVTDAAKARASRRQESRQQERQRLLLENQRLRDRISTRRIPLAEALVID